MKTQLILQIHDELLFEGPAEEAEQVKEIAVREMAAAYALDPPLAVEAGIGPDWLSAEVSRLARTVILAALLAVAVSVPATASAAPHAKTFGGVIADIPSGGHRHEQGLARIAANLPYSGGPVLLPIAPT